MEPEDIEKNPDESAKSTSPDSTTESNDKSDGERYVPDDMIDVATKMKQLLSGRYNTYYRHQLG